MERIGACWNCGRWTRVQSYVAREWRHECNECSHERIRQTYGTARIGFPVNNAGTKTVVDWAKS
jgi:hypothetical protein